MQPPAALPTDSSKAIVAVHERLQYQLLAAMTAYSARYGALPADAYAKLTKIDDHLWPMPKRGLAEATEFIRDHGARHGIAPFDDEAKAILHAAYGQGGVLDAKWETHDKLDRRKQTGWQRDFLRTRKRAGVQQSTNGLRST